MLNPKLRTRFEDWLMIASWKFIVGYCNVKPPTPTQPHKLRDIIKLINIINFSIDLCSSETFLQIFTKFSFCYCLDKFLVKTICYLINSPPIWLKFHNTILVSGAKEYSWRKWPFSPSIIVENLFAESSSWLVIF